jgi:hypothetical protein
MMLNLGVVPYAPHPVVSHGEIKKIYKEIDLIFLILYL